MIGYLEKKKGFAAIFMMIIAVEIFAISSIPGSGFAPISVDLSSLYHLIVFFLLAFFILVFISGGKRVKSKYIFTAIALSLVYALLDEVHQIFVPRRFFSVGDMLID